MFREVSLFYRPDLPPALSNVNFSIRAGERIGIVGRTGSGKTSILQALFRLRPYSGSIILDGDEISRLSLFSLRSRISIIPQSPVLFSGTIRSNLDPEESFNDSEIYQVLSRVGLYMRVKNLFKGLYSEVGDFEGIGESFSVGEKQLLCFARALLRGNSILCLDEATASLAEKDSQALHSLLSELTGVTVLLIAHRLSSVRWLDKILGMAGGRVVEFDSPQALLARPDSLFRQLMDLEENTGAAP